MSIVCYFLITVQSRIDGVYQSYMETNSLHSTMLTVWSLYIVSVQRQTTSIQNPTITFLVSSFVSWVVHKHQIKHCISQLTTEPTGKRSVSKTSRNQKSMRSPHIGPKVDSRRKFSNKPACDRAIVLVLQQECLHLGRVSWLLLVDWCRPWWGHKCENDTWAFPSAHQMSASTAHGSAK